MIAVKIPLSTYRLQFRKSFTFCQALKMIPYLDNLGISHIYSSPLLAAMPNSPHGYDVVNHERLNPEIGTRGDFEDFVKELRKHGMGLILDIVPNHMVAGKDNSWWMDVLENGLASMYADYFDIQWFPRNPKLFRKILVPVLSEPYGQAMEKGDFKLAFLSDRAKFELHYLDHVFPLDPQSYGQILMRRQEDMQKILVDQNGAWTSFKTLSANFSQWPHDQIRTDRDRIDYSGQRQKYHAALAAFCRRHPMIVKLIDESLRDFQCAANDTENCQRLHHLLESQNYRLAFWQIANEEINYRRFFDNNHLIGLKTENPEVFAKTHRLVLELIEQRLVDGLRVDHPDGLYDPEAYFHRLQSEIARRLNSSGGMKTDSDEPFYIVAEKILAQAEKIPRHWPLCGSTGYDFANQVGGIFIARENAPLFDKIYAGLTQSAPDFDATLYHCKKLVMNSMLASELNVLAFEIFKISEASWRTCDFTLGQLRAALAEIVACFPVYRTYRTDAGLSVTDAANIRQAVASARRKNPAISHAVYDFIFNVLIGDYQTDPTLADSLDLLHFAMRLQQYTAPVAAKGLEDTCFYRDNRLVSLNEVGGDPRVFGIESETFHQINLERSLKLPHSLLATSTHDTKRSEDVRLRIHVLSELPRLWKNRLRAWHKINRRHKRKIRGRAAPDANEEYLLYQTLAGAWPLESLSGVSNRNDDAAFRERMADYFVKALREAKINTSWICRNAAYEDAAIHFLRQILAPHPSNAFLNDFLSFQCAICQSGLLSSLSQILIKFTAPGVPDIFQGNEIWDFSLVDPDNRRPVNYEIRKEYLDEIDALLRTRDTDTASYQAGLKDIVRQANDGRIKLLTTTVALRLRREMPEVFQKGGYLPLPVRGEKAEHAFAFARRFKNQIAITVVPRLLAHFQKTPGTSRFWEPKAWRKTSLVLPKECEHLHFYSHYSGRIHKPQNLTGHVRLDLFGLFEVFPVGLLSGADEEPHRR